MDSPASPQRAAIYLRVSSPGQEENYSLPTQEEECRRHCAARGYAVAQEHVYCDGAQRSYTLDRPGLNAMRDELRAGHLDVIVALKMDRLSRDQVQQGVLIYEADRHGVRLDFALEQFDDTPTGRFIRSANGFVAEIERHNIRERTQRGRRKRAREGKLLAAAFPLYGYLWEDEATSDQTGAQASERKGGKQQKVRYRLDPEAAPIVRRIYREVADGSPLRTLAKRLDAEGIPTPSQHMTQLGLYHQRAVSTYWSAATLHRLLLNPAYIGEHSAWRWRAVYRQDRDPDSSQIRDVRAVSQRALDDEERIPLPVSTCPPIVEREVAEAAWVRLRHNREQSPRRNHDPEATLLRAGYIFCGHCGHALYTHLLRGKWTYYCADWRRRADGKQQCPGNGHSIYAEKMDAIVWEHVSQTLNHPAHLTKALAQWQAEHETQEQRATANLDAVIGQLRQLEAKAANLTLGIADAATSDARAILTRALDTLTEQIRHLTAEQDRLQHDARENASHAAQVASLADWARSVARRLASFTYQQKRVALYALGVRATLWRADHSPRYTVTYDFKGLNAGTGSDIVSLTT
jgi:site-specific DNA recombinase